MDKQYSIISNQKIDQDLAKIHSKPYITKYLTQYEKIILSVQLDKYNNVQKMQTRILLLTSTQIMNISNSQNVASFIKTIFVSPVRRQILLKDIREIIVSTQNDEFVIKVQDQYDYRYSSPQRKHILLNIYEQWLTQDQHQHQQICFYFLPINNLDKFTKHKDRTKDQVSVLVEGVDGHQMSFQELAQKLDSIQQQFIQMSFSNRNVEISNFLMIRNIVKNEQSRVLLAQCKMTNLLYAIQIYRKDKIIDKNMLDHICNKKDIMNQLKKFAFILSLENHFQDERYIYFQSEFVRGGTFLKFLRNQYILTEKQAQFYAAQVLLALEYMHSKNILYLNLNPKKILLDDKGYVKLFDFGSSFQEKGIVDYRRDYGSMDVEYMSPELIQGNRPNRAADWWSFGCLIYEMVMGDSPFYHKKNWQMINQIMEADIDWHKNSIKASPHLMNLVEILTKKNADNRFQNASEIKNHVWFKNMDFEMIVRKRVQTQFKPQIDRLDHVSYLQSTVQDTQTFNDKIVEQNQSAFEQFS